MKNETFIKIEQKDLNCLMFWSMYGITKAKNGSNLKRLYQVFKNFSSVMKGSIKDFKNPEKNLGKYI